MTVVDGLVRMEGFATQKNLARKEAKKAKRVHWRRYVPPRATKESLPARLCLAEAAHSLYGRVKGKQGLAEIIQNVVEKCSGKDYGGKAKQAADREARHALAAANIAKMRAQLAKVM